MGNRLLRTAWVVIGALLFSQLALASHACARLGAAAASLEVAMPDGCTEQPEAPSLCREHCRFGESAFDLAKPLPSIDVTAGPALFIRDVPSVATLSPRDALDLQPPPDPPPAIRFSVLRI